MNPRALLFLVAAAVLLAGGYWLLADGERRGELAERGTVARTEAPSAEAPAGDAALEPPAASAPDSPGAEAAPRRYFVQDQTVTVPGTEGERYLVGRVTLPPGVPDDEEVFVRVRGTGAGELRVPLAAPTPAQLAQNEREFVVALPGGASRVTLDLEARYLFLPERREVPLDGDRTEVALAPELGGLLVLRLSPPAGRARAELADTSAKLEGFSDTTSRVTREGRQTEPGLFLFPGLPADLLYSVDVESGEFTDAERGGVRVFPGEASVLELELIVGVRLEGTLTGPGGAPVANAWVRAMRRNPHSGTWPWIDTVSVRTGLAGEFVLTGVAPGELRVVASAEAAEEVSRELGRHVDGDVVSGVELSLSSGERVSGRVRWPAGDPAAGASVSVRSLAQRWGAGEKAVTDADGAFTCAGLTGGPYEVRVRAERGEEKWGAERRVEGPALGLELVLQPGDRVTGFAVDDRGAPLERFTVRAAQRDASGGTVKDRFRDGEFELQGLASGTWDVHVEAKGHADSKPRRVQLPEDVGELRFELDRHARVSGRVVSSAPGRELGEVEVLARAPKAKTAAAEARAEPASDDEEFVRFELQDVAPGELELVARADGWRDSEPVRVSLAPGQELDGVLLVLRAGARLAGRVDASIEDFAARKLLASPAGSYEYHTTLCAADGSFAFDGLEPGRWVVCFDWRSSGGAGDDWVAGFQRRAEEEVDLLAGETTFVVLGAPRDEAVALSGTVTANGEPRAEHLLYVFPADDRAAGPVNIARSDADGAYSLRVPAPGTYRFTVGENQSRQVAFVRDVPPGPEFELDFELPSASLAGVILRTDGTPSAKHPLMLMSADAPPQSRSLGDMQITFADGQGAFHFDGLAPGVYYLRTGGWGLATGGLGVRLLAEVELEAGAQHEDLVVEVEPEAVIEGGVLDADGTPAPGVAIEVANPAGLPLFIWEELRTDYTGAFRLPGLGPGPVTVTARDEHGASATATLELHPGEVATLTLELEY